MTIGRALFLVTIDRAQQRVDIDEAPHIRAGQQIHTPRQGAQVFAQYTDTRLSSSNIAEPSANLWNNRTESIFPNWS